jgi:hypothetical protein
MYKIEEKVSLLIFIEVQNEDKMKNIISLGKLKKCT